MYTGKTIFLFLIITLISNFLYGQDYGGEGFIDMPSAYMLSDADIKVTHSSDFFHQGTAITYQITPFLMGTFRYSGFNYTWVWDRNIALKARLIKETTVIPEISLGIRDIGGTSIFGAEYLVASKNINNLSVTMGMGWGRLSGDGPYRNPLITLSEKFQRRAGSTGSGGTVRSKDFFSGEKFGLFGGLKYQFSNYPLQFLVEYSSDNFQSDSNMARGRSQYYKYVSNINFGIKWIRSDDTSFMITRQHGDWGITADFVTNTRETPRAYRINSSNLNTFLPTSINNNLFELLNYDANRRGLNIIDGEIKNGEIRVVISASRINFLEDLVTETMDLLSVHLPREINIARIIILDEGFQVYEMQLNLQDYRDYYRQRRPLNSINLTNLDQIAAFYI